MNIEEFESTVNDIFQGEFVVEYNSCHKEKDIVIYDKEKDKKIIEVFEKTWQRVFLKAVIEMSKYDGRDPKYFQAKLDLIP